MITTRLSSKGQIIIPLDIREAHAWKPGVEFQIQDTEQGLLLVPVTPFKPTTLKDVLGCANYQGPKKSLKDMEHAIAKGAKKCK